MNLMRSIQPAVRAIVATIFLLCCFRYSSAQSENINAQAMERLVKKWNDAHNNRNAGAFASVYNEQVVMDKQQLTRERCISLKRKLFREHPDYKQKITSGLTYKTYPGGIIKCDFKKEVTLDGALWKYPAYVLISREDNRYVIAGESDNDSGHTLNLYRKIKTAEDLAAAVEEAHKREESFPDIREEDTIHAFDSENTPSATDRETDYGYETFNERDTLMAEPAEDPAYAEKTSSLPFLTEETVAIPLKYVYAFIGILVIASVLILVAGTFSGKRNQRSSKTSNGRKTNNYDHYDKEQSARFERFVITLFDPKYFRAFRAKRETVLAHAPDEMELFPELEFEFNHKESNASFIIESLYIKEIRHRHIQIASPGKVGAYRQLDEDDNDLYVILGIEGSPDDPKEMYLIPVKEITSSLITYPELQRYRKYGMFFYNTESNRLQ